MTAVLARARAELRTGARSALVLVLMLGVFGGAVMASAAGARRQVSAYPRFLASSHAPDAFVLSPPEGLSNLPIPHVDLDLVQRLPQVERFERAEAPFAVAEAADGHVLWDGSMNLVPLRGLTHPRVLSGRLPAQDSLDEVAVGYREHQDPRVHVGATMGIDLIRPGVNPFEFASAPPKEDLFAPIRVRVVGVVVYPGELSGDTNDVFVSPAFERRYGKEGLTFAGLVVQLKRGLADFPAFAKEVDAISQGALSFSQLDEVRFARRATELQAVALWLFAILAGLAGLLIFAQSVTRQTILAGTENPTLRALGMTANQLIGVTMARAAAIGVAGAAAAVIMAVALSPLTPLGLARLAEPNPGVAVDAVVLGLGTVALVAVVPLLAAIPAWRAARARGGLLGTATPSRLRPSVVADSFARAGLPPTAVAGVRLALEPGRGRSAVPVRSTVLGITVAIAAFAASFAFLGSYRHLLHTPRLYGVDFDVGVGNPFLGPDAGPELVRVLREDHSVAEFAGGNILRFVQVHTPGTPVQRINVWAFDPIQGSVHLTVADGRWPRGTKEIALGGRTMRTAHARIGDDVTIQAGGITTTMRVVGRVVIPEGGFGPGLGDGGAMSFQALKRFFPDAGMNAFPVRLNSGADKAAVAKRLNKELEPFGASVADLNETPNLTNLKRIQSLPLILAGLLALAGAATLMHTLVSSIRRRRRDLAILKTLGFVRGQVSAAVAWQATTLVILALVIGIPVGIAAGRLGWTFFANQLGFVPEPQVSLVPVLLAIPATMVLANLIAMLPGRAASRVRPALVLRSE